MKTVCQKNCFQPGGPSTLSLDIPYPKQWRVQSRPYRQLLRGDNITVSLVFHIFPYTFALSLNSGIFLNMYQQVELIKRQHVISALTSLICLLSPMVINEQLTFNQKPRNRVNKRDELQNNVLQVWYHTQKQTLHTWRSSQIHLVPITILTVRERTEPKVAPH